MPRYEVTISVLVDAESQEEAWRMVYSIAPSHWHAEIDEPMQLDVHGYDKAIEACSREHTRLHESLQAVLDGEGDGGDRVDLIQALRIRWPSWAGGLVTELTEFPDDDGKH